MAKYRKVKVKEWRTEINYKVVYWRTCDAITHTKEFLCQGMSNEKRYYTNIVDYAAPKNLPSYHGWTHNEAINRLSVKELNKVYEWIKANLDGVKRTNGTEWKLIEINREVKHYLFKETLYEPVESDILLLEDKR